MHRLPSFPSTSSYDCDIEENVGKEDINEREDHGGDVQRNGCESAVARPSHPSRESDQSLGHRGWGTQHELHVDVEVEIQSLCYKQRFVKVHKSNLARSKC